MSGTHGSPVHQHAAAEIQLITKEEVDDDQAENKKADAAASEEEITQKQEETAREEAKEALPAVSTEEAGAKIISASASGGGDDTVLRLPRLEDASDAAFVRSSFDPVNLLEVGIREWRDRTLSLQCLRKSRTVSAGHPLRAMPSRRGGASIAAASKKLGAPTTVPDFFDIGKDWQEVYDRDHKSGFTPQPSKDIDYQVIAGQSHDHDYQQQQIQLPEDYYPSLSLAPHASLIHLVILYHQELIRHGLGEEAIRIATLLEGLREAEPAHIEADLHGMDLLLKDGLLELYLRIQPYLPPIPTQIVKFKSLTYSRNIFFLDGGYDTVLTKAIECIEWPIQRAKGPQRLTVLKDVTGYLMPGTMTLVLGPPACGKSSLHHALSGRFYAGGLYEGAVTYNNEDLRNISIHRLASVVGHLDVHLPLLTVRETLEFARKCILGYKPKHYGPELLEIMGEALNVGQDPKIEINLSMMGLKHVANRLVGSAMFPSIPEDERHRVTAAEMFCGAHSVYFFDQLNAIAEDSITYDLLTSIRIFTRVRQITVMASLLQPSSEIFDLFDRLIVLNQGHVVYQGPRQDALSYFEGLGYKKPEHLGVGEFLQEVTTKDGVSFLQPGFDKMQLEDFVSSYQKSNMYKDICRVVDSPNLLQELWVQGNHPLGVAVIENKSNTKFGDGVEESSTYMVSNTFEKNGSLVSVSMDHTTNLQAGDRIVAVGGSVGPLHYIDLCTPNIGRLQNALADSVEPVRVQLERSFNKVQNEHTNQFFGQDYALSWKAESMLLAKRELKVTWRNKVSLAIRLFQVLFLSSFVSFLLFRVQNDANQLNMNLYRTGFFVSLLNMTSFNTVQLPALFDERLVYYKHKEAHFFRPISYLLAKSISGFPFSLCEATIWTVIVYFITGMSVANGGWHFFVYYLVIVLTVLNGASMIRFIGFFAPDKERAGMLVGLLVALFVLFAGFLVPRFQVPKYWIWMYYINPLQWAITALVINEYNSSNYNQLCKDVLNLTKIPQCVGRPNDTVGHAYLARGQFYTSNHWIALSVGVMCAWILLWNVLAYLALTKLTHEKIFRVLRPLNAKNKVAEDLQEAVQVEDVESAKQSLTRTALPVTLSWHELSYDLMIPSMQTSRTILKYVSGWGEPYDMVALIGSTGSGKTTLLNCLAGRKVLAERIGGQVLVNGYPKVQEKFGYVMGYVDKIDAYTPFMTVRETVAYSAATRLDKISSKRNQQEFVEEVLELTELKSMENMLVVSLINDVTSDQEKRLAIATELAANPSILFLDDPTIGLDSSRATQITRCLQQIASTGRLVITTFKYPSQRVLSRCTKVQILKTGGETVYFGPVGSNGELIKKYFEALPGAPLFPPNKSIAAYAIDVIGDDLTYRKSVKDYAFEYRVSELALRNHVHLQHLRRAKGQIGPKIETGGYTASFASKLRENIMTLQRQYWRNVNYSWGRMLSFLIMSILLGSIYFKADYRNTPAMSSRAGAIFISCVFVGLTNAQNTIPQVMQVRVISKRERAVHQSNALIYNISFALAEIPYLLAANLIFCSIFLPMTKMAVQSAGQFFLYWLISSEFYVVITFLGILLAVVSPMPQVASVLVPTVIGMWISTSGLVIPKTKILHQFIWIYWTNPLQYASNSLTSLAFYCDVNKPTCLNNGLNSECMLQPDACPLCNCPRLTDANNVFVWSQISSTRSLQRDRIPYDILALFLYAILIRILTQMALRFLKHNRRT